MAKKPGGSQTKRPIRTGRKSELIFMTHDAAKKNGKTFAKVRDAALLELQSTLPHGLYIVKSLRALAKVLPPAPTLGRSNVGDPGSAERALDEEQLKMMFQIKYTAHLKTVEKFDLDFHKAYGILLKKYCSKEMKRVIEELPDYTSIIQDNPIELLKAIERQVHVPDRAVYPTLTVIEAMAGLLSVRQGEKESLLSYLERYKSEKNVMEVLVGKSFLNKFVEQSPEYQMVEGDSTLTSAAKKEMQDELRDRTRDSFYALLFLRGGDQKRYGKLLPEYRQAYANGQRDLYPKSLRDMFEVMKTIPQPKPKKPAERKSDEELESSFAQKSETSKTSKKPEAATKEADQEPRKKRACFCCGKPGCYPKKCDKKDSVSEADWYIHTGVVLSQIIVEENDEQDDNPTGFSGVQLTSEETEEIILDSGSTISLFRDKKLLKDIQFAKNSLLMLTNAGKKQITKQGNIPGFGRVWFDPSAVANLFSLSDIIRRGNRVVFDSDKANRFEIYTKNGTVIHYDLNERDLYALSKVIKSGEDEGVCTNQVTIPNAPAKLIEGLTPRELDRARAARKLYHDLGAPGYPELRHILSTNGIRDCPVSVEDMKLAEKAFGKDVAVLKGKRTRPHPPVVRKDDIVDLPSELQLRSVDIAMDVVYVEDQAFLNAVDRSAKFKSLACLGTSKKVTADQLLQGIRQVVHHYKKQNIDVDFLHLDNEFKSFKLKIEKEFGCQVNLCNPDEHVGDIERSNRTLQDRVRVSYHRLPFRVIPRAMIRHSCMRETRSQNFFVKKKGISRYFCPNHIINRKTICFDKELKFSFGDYGESSHVNKPQSNDNRGRTLSCIYLRPSLSLQGGHDLLDLQTNRVITRPKFEKCKMTEAVIARVEQIAASEGIKSLKFYNRKRQVLVHQANDLLEGVERNVEILSENESLNNLPPLVEDSPGELSSESDSDEEESLNQEEVSDLLGEAIDRATRNEVDQEEVEEEIQPEVEVDDGVDESEDEVVCDEVDVSEIEPDLVSEEEIRRSARQRTAPARLNPSTGRNYAQALCDKEVQVPKPKRKWSTKLENVSRNTPKVFDEGKKIRWGAELESEILKKSPPILNKATPSTKSTPISKESSLDNKSSSFRKTPSSLSSKNMSDQTKDNNKIELRPAWKRNKKGKDELAVKVCNYIRVVQEVHNIRTSAKDEDGLKYIPGEEKVVAQALCHAQLYILQKGIKIFGERGTQAAKSEVKQLHDRVGFRALAVKELTRQERERAQEGLLFLTEKKDGSVKGRLAYNGKKTREWISREDKSSPTAHAESILLTCAIDAKEHRDVMSLDIPNAFIQAELKRKKGEERVVMKVRGRIVDWLVALDPAQYEKKVVYENGVKVLYLEILRAIYGMLVASLLWYRKLRKALEEFGFKFNDYDPCVANKPYEGHQQTIRFHVDDLLCSCVSKRANDILHQWAQEMFGKLKPVTVTRGPKHDFLGMQLDFGLEKGACHVIQETHVSEMVETYTGKHNNSPTPAGLNLFKKGAGELLDDKKKEIFHTVVAKGIFIAKRSRPDIAPTVAVLSGRVRDPNLDDWKKLGRLCGYLKRTLSDHLVLRVDGDLNFADWFVDASFAVHEDFKSHTGGLMMLSQDGGAIISSSIKQQLNTRSSTEAELVAVDDMAAKIVWVKNFLKSQGMEINCRLHQDNQSAILLEEKGMSSAGKRSRHINVRYFFIKDLVEKGMVEINYCPTEKMIADYMTKPLQGSLFHRFKCRILGLKRE